MTTEWHETLRFAKKVGAEVAALRHERDLHRQALAMIETRTVVITHLVAPGIVGIPSVDALLRGHVEVGQHLEVDARSADLFVEMGIAKLVDGPSVQKPSS